MHYVFLLLFIFLLSACNREGVAERNNHAENLATTQTQADTLPIRTLTVLSPDTYEFEINRAIRLMTLEAVELPEDERFHLDVDITFYHWQDWEDQLQSLQIRKMAGDSYDLFFLDRHPLWHYVQSGFLVDFYTLIDADPIINREDFFLNPLTAMEIDGGLYAFPISFGFYYVFVNANLPESITYQFSHYTTITIVQLMDLYIDLMQNYGHEYGHLNFFGGYSPFIDDGPRRFMESYMVRFIDMDNRSANLTDGSFIDFLYRHRQVFAKWKPTGHQFRSLVNPIDFRERTGEDAFWLAASDYIPGYALNPGQMRQPYFLHGIPVADAYGRLLISPEHRARGGSQASVCITNGGNIQLSWELTKHLMCSFTFFSLPENLYGTPYSGFGQDHRWLKSTQITRDIFAHHMDRVFWSRAYMQDIIMGRYHVIQQDVDAAIARLAMYNEMPMAMAFPFIPEDLGADNIELFNRGVISAEVLAQRLQNSISIWLLGG